MILPLILSTMVSYLIGSINFSLLAAFLKDGKDLRNYGSGNAGATNLLRNYGWKLCFAGFLGDSLKGVFAVSISRMLFIFMADSSGDSSIFDGAEYIFSAAAVIGHIYPAYFGFRGGKGVATALLLSFYLDWRVATAVFALGFPILLITKYVSAAVLVGLSVYPLFTYLIDGKNMYGILFSFFLFYLMTFKHTANLKRLLNHCESKVSFSRKGSG